MIEVPVWVFVILIVLLVLFFVLTIVNATRWDSSQVKLATTQERLKYEKEMRQYDNKETSRVRGDFEQFKNDIALLAPSLFKDLSQPTDWGHRVWGAQVHKLAERKRKVEKQSKQDAKLEQVEKRGY